MKFLLPIVFFAFFISCQKGIDDINPPVRTTQNDSVVFSKFVILDTTVGIRPDTTEKILFFYDNMKRLFYQEDYSYTNGVADPPAKVTFYYNSNDTLPYKRFLVVPNTNGPADTVTNYYNFVNGKLLSDSSITQVGLRISSEMRNFTYYTNKIVDTFSQYSINPITPSSKGYETINFQKVNDLIISQKDTIMFNYNSPGNSRVGTSAYTFSYDNNHNPFNVLKPLNPYYATEDDGNIFGFEKNNFSEANQSFDSPYWGPSSYHYKYVYQYNSNGYPTVVRITDLNNPSVVYKCMYFYTK